jgi:hypothetical protein
LGQRWKISLPQHLKIVWTTNSNNAQFPNFISDMDSGDGNEMVIGFWWYVTMVHDGTDDIIYVNGQEVNANLYLANSTAPARPLGFGNNPIEGAVFHRRIGQRENLQQSADRRRNCHACMLQALPALMNLISSGLTSIRCSPIRPPSC